MVRLTESNILPSLHAVIGDALNLAILVEIDRDNAAGDFFLRQEGSLLGKLRDVVENLAADRRNGGRGAQDDQYLFLRRAERDLLKAAFGHHVTALVTLRDPRAATGTDGRAQGRGIAAMAVSLRAFLWAIPEVTRSRVCPCIIRPVDLPRRHIEFNMPVSGDQQAAPDAQTGNLSMFLKWWRQPSRDRNIDTIYGVIVAQARQPVFYTGYGVPDTVEGRFDMIVLHLFLYIRRTSGRVTESDAAQPLFDRFCADLDGNLREMGVGDLTVPKRMQKFAGRSTAAVRPMRRRWWQAIRDDRNLGDWAERLWTAKHRRTGCAPLGRLYV